MGKRRRSVLNYQRQLDFFLVLPGKWALNYTYLNSLTEGIRDVQGIDWVDLNLRDTLPHLFNDPQGYEIRNFTAVHPLISQDLT